MSRDEEMRLSAVSTTATATIHLNQSSSWWNALPRQSRGDCAVRSDEGVAGCDGIRQRPASPS
jgi:hypothetical protein